MSLWIYFVDTSDGIHERALPFDADVPAVLSVQEEFASDRRVLAMVHPMGRSPFQAVIDADGSLLAKFDEETVALFEGDRKTGRFRTGFSPRTVSADGTLLAGTRGIEDGHALFTSEIFIADAGGQWVVPLEDVPQGINPHSRARKTGSRSMNTTQTRTRASSTSAASSW